MILKYALLLMAAISPALAFASPDTFTITYQIRTNGPYESFSQQAIVGQSDHYNFQDISKQLKGAKLDSVIRSFDERTNTMALDLDVTVNGEPTRSIQFDQLNLCQQNQWRSDHLSINVYVDKKDTCRDSYPISPKGPFEDSVLSDVRLQVPTTTVPLSKVYVKFNYKLASAATITLRPTCNNQRTVCQDYGKQGSPHYHSGEGQSQSFFMLTKPGHITGLTYSVQSLQSGEEIHHGYIPLKTISYN